MSAIADTVAELGVGAYDMQERVIRYGPTGQKERHTMYWRADLTTPMWLGKPSVLIDLRDSWLLDLRSTSPHVWEYLSTPVGGAGQFGQSSVSWNPYAIRHASDAFAAGLVLQERILWDAWTWIPTDAITLATVLFPMNPSDEISGLIDPASNLGTQFAALGGLRRFQDTGWVDSAVQSCAKENLAPHLYAHTVTQTGNPNQVEYLLCQWRWKGIPV